MKTKRRSQRFGTARTSRLTVACLAAFGATAAVGQTELPDRQCSILAGWYTTTKLPNGASPFASYLTLLLESVSSSTGRNLNDVVLVIDSPYPAAGYGGWFVYPWTYQAPTGGATYPNIVPDAGSVNPFLVGNPIFAKKRRFHMVVASDTTTLATLPANIRALLPEDDADARKNLIFWPNSARAKVFALLNRTYAAYDGYTRGGFHGPLNIAWPKITSYDAKTGTPIPCGTVQVARDQVQDATPWNTVGNDGLDRDAFDFRGIAPGLLPGAPSDNLANSAPVPNRQLVEFFRVPPFWTGWPGGSVPNPDQDTPDKCANYLVATLNESRIALIRQPLVPVYPNPNPPLNGTVPAAQQVGAYNLQVLGKLRSNYKPGSPDTFGIGDAEIQTDANGGATFLVWPTTLDELEKERVVAYARSKGWNILAGNLAARSNYLTGLVVRQNGPASNYYGASYPAYDSSGNLIRTGVGCYLGPKSKALDALGLTPVPNKNFNEIGSRWAMSYKTSGPYALQGVNCYGIRELVEGRCQARLEEHIRDTGGQYYYTGPVPWVPPSATP